MHPPLVWTGVGLLSELSRAFAHLLSGLPGGAYRSIASERARHPVGPVQLRVRDPPGRP
jgi:hypothetical protein